VFSKLTELESNAAKIIKGRVENQSGLHLGGREKFYLRANNEIPYMIKTNGSKGKINVIGIINIASKPLMIAMGSVETSTTVTIRAAKI
jgi:hypothetical protein